MSGISREELVNCLTHGVGAALSCFGAAVLVVVASLSGDPWRIVGSAVFGAAMVTLYVASTLYHAVQTPRVKSRLKVFDHAAIYVLIAGTYTPFTLLGLRGAWGWSLFGIIWGLAAAGIVCKMFWTGRFPRASTAIYLGMGWLIVIAAVPLIRVLSLQTLILLAAGGAAYTIGTVFYHNRRVPFAHGIWHGFVLVGSGCHYTAVLLHTL